MPKDISIRVSGGQRVKFSRAQAYKLIDLCSGHLEAAECLLGVRSFVQQGLIDAKGHPTDLGRLVASQLRLPERQRETVSGGT